jgi:hypothetical protein
MLAAIARKDYTDRRRRQAQGIAAAKAAGNIVAVPKILIATGNRRNVGQENVLAFHHARHEMLAQHSRQSGQTPVALMCDSKGDGAEAREGCVEDRRRGKPGQPIVGITNSASDRTPVGQRVVMVLSRV